MNRFLIGNMAGLIVAGVLFTSIHPGLADNATNTTVSRPTNEISIKLTAGHDNSPSDSYFGLPKEAFDRLSSDQIAQLAQIHKDQNSNISDSISLVLIPVCMFTMICICVWLGVSTKLKRNQMLHETIRQMIEKGQPIPPELLQPTEACRRPRNDLRSGLVFISVGVGLILFFYGVGGGMANIWGLGLIPLLMGVAYLIVWKMEANKNGQPK